MNMKTIVAIAIILVVLGAGYVVARPESSNSWGGMMGGGSYGNGMMGSYGNGGYGSGITGGFSGMMGQYAGMMSNLGNGIWNGMMGSYRGMMGYGNGATAGYGGMMGGNGNGFGGGMMGGGMMGNSGSGMMGGQGGTTDACGTMMGYSGSSYGVNATQLTIEEAKGAVEQYLASTGNADLKLTEVMEFDNNFYAEVKENSTGIHAFELLVNKYTGTIVPEMGPNMMWNTKYSPMAGMMGGQVGQVGQAQATVTEKQAVEYAQKYLDRALPGTKADEADAFYGYYTIHVLKDNKIYGMLSVNSYTGAVWYHNWHGAFVKMLEVE